LRLISPDTRAIGPRLLLVSPHNSYRIAPYIQAAHFLGIQILVVSQGKHSLVSEVARGLHVDFSEPEQAMETILEEAHHAPFAGVVGTDDSTVELAAQIASRLGLLHNDPTAALYSRRKDLARACLQQAGLPVPRHMRLSLQQLPDAMVQAVNFPCVVKPLSLSGSRGVIRVDDLPGLHKAMQRIAIILRRESCLPEEERTQVLLEEFIGGPEVAVEGILRKGVFTLLAIFDKPDPLEGPFFEETYYITPSRHEPRLQQQVVDCVTRACDAYGLREGPVHAELRLYKGEAWIMEIAARTIGGQCARLLRYGTGHGLEELVLSHATGQLLEASPGAGGAGVLMIPIPAAGVLRRVEGIMRALKVPFIEDVEISIREGYELQPLPEGASYLGFIFARAPTPAQAEQALRQAHACLKIVIAPLLKVTSGE
jgi:biotin carboxylase